MSFDFFWYVLVFFVALNMSGVGVEIPLEFNLVLIFLGMIGVELQGIRRCLECGNNEEDDDDDDE